MTATLTHVWIDATVTLNGRDSIRAALRKFRSRGWTPRSLIGRRNCFWLCASFEPIIVRISL